MDVQLSSYISIQARLQKSLEKDGFLFFYKEKKPQLISSEQFFFSGGNKSKKSLSCLN